MPLSGSIPRHGQLSGGTLEDRTREAVKLNDLSRLDVLDFRLRGFREARIQQ